MPASLTPILRDYLIRFQQTSLKETGRRPMTYTRTPMDEQCVLPGCQRPGFVFWQPVGWKDGRAPLGELCSEFHSSIVEYLSMCQFMEVRFRLPVVPANSPLSFLYGRIFESCKNTEFYPPERAFEDALQYHREHPQYPLALTMAATCDGGEPLLVQLQASDGQMFIQRVERDVEPLFCRMTLDRLLPKLQFVYDF